MVRKLFLAAMMAAQSLIPMSALSQVKSSPAPTPKKAAPAPAEPSKNSNILFEGYSKILLGGVHVGYNVLRYEFDPKKKIFTATYLTKTDELGGNILESLKAVADQDLKPISYEYTSLVDKKSKIIDAKFSKNRMTATVKEGKQSKKLVTDVPKGAFAAIFLYYVILRSPSGLKTETRYNYKAIAEEDGLIYDGVATIGKEEKFNGIRAFKATNVFKDISYTFYMTDSGEALMTETPGSNVKTILVARPQEATANFKVPTDVMKSLFGEMPMGISNTVSRTLQEEAQKRVHPSPSKQEGVPYDPKIMLKGKQDSESRSSGE